MKPTMRNKSEGEGEKPILFSGAMVRAILAGRKTQTRRVGKDQSKMPHCRDVPNGFGIGNRLWCRETWFRVGDKYVYRADEETGWIFARWKPSIHMPRQASRITLKITDIRPERLQDISEGDARAEGAMYHDGRGVGHSGYRHDINHGVVYDTARESYKALWDSIAPIGAKWNDNPWVWAVEFRKEGV